MGLFLTNSRNSARLNLNVPDSPEYAKTMLYIGTILTNGDVPSSSAAALQPKK
jgi:hypothetical protein